MPVQTTYAAAHGAAFEGQRVDLQLANIISKVVEEALGIPFGRAVVRGAADAGVVLPSAAGDEFIGVTEMTSAGVEDCDGVHQYEYQREANIMDFGPIYVYTEVAVVPGDPVYFRHTAGVAPLDVVGRFRNDADTASADLIPGATFESTTVAGGIAIVKLPASNGDGVAVAPGTSETITALGASAVSLATTVTYIDSTLGVQALTLADGRLNQRKVIKMLVDGGNSVVTPANFLEGTTITFDDVGDSVELIFDGTNWGVIGTATATVA